MLRFFGFSSGLLKLLGFSAIASPEKGKSEKKGKK
jgi:hypothetical protein